MLLPKLTVDAINGVSESIIFLPINIDKVHWACLVLSRPKGNIHIYDSLERVRTKKFLGKIADDISEKCDAADYAHYIFENPIQKDGTSCGFFFCLHFWKTLDLLQTRDVTARGQTLFAERCSRASY